MMNKKRARNGRSLKARLKKAKMMDGGNPVLVTVDEAAAPHSSLAFMFWGAGVFIFPLMLLYTVISYAVFRGKVKPTAAHY